MGFLLMKRVVEHKAVAIPLLRMKRTSTQNRIACEGKSLKNRNRQSQSGGSMAINLKPTSGA